MSDAVICNCQYCNQSLEFDSIHAGQMSACPYCGLDTILFVPQFVYKPPRTTPPYKKFHWLKKGWKYAWSNSPEGMLVGGGVCLFSIFGFLIWLTGTQSQFFGLGSDICQMLIVILMILTAIGIYFLPSFIAYSNKKKNFEAIFILNIFLGWTILGWVGSLVWAVTKD